MTRDFYNTWQDLARTASVEHDFEKLNHLIQQLNRALDEEDGRIPPGVGIAIGN